MLILFQSLNDALSIESMLLRGWTLVKGAIDPVGGWRQVERNMLAILMLGWLAEGPMVGLRAYGRVACRAAAASCCCC